LFLQVSKIVENLPNFAEGIQASEMSLDSGSQELLL